MNRSIATVLVFFIFTMHSAWAIGVHVDSGHVIDSVTHIESHHNNMMADNDTPKHCEEHGCHISAHATGLFSVISFSLFNPQQYMNSSIKLSRYFYSQTIPQRPPKV